MHARAAIRQAVVGRLLGTTSYPTAAENRVFSSRFVPYRRAQLPSISVYAKSEPVDPASRNTAPRSLTRNLELIIEAAVDEGSVMHSVRVQNVDDALDDLAVEIERAIDQDPTLGGAASDMLLSNTEIEIVTEVDGKSLVQPVALIALTYAVRYYTSAPEAADMPLDDLNTVDAKTSLGGSVIPANQAEDLIVNLQEG